MKTKALLITLALAATTSFSQAIVFTWTGAADGDWTNTANWDANGVPVDNDGDTGLSLVQTDSIVFGATTLPTTNIPDIGGRDGANRDTPTILFNSGGTITLAAGVGSTSGIVTNGSSRTVFTIGDGFGGGTEDVILNLSIIGSLIRHAGGGLIHTLRINSDGTLNIAGILNFSSESTGGNPRFGQLDIAGGTVVVTGTVDAILDAPENFVAFTVSGGSLTATYGHDFADFTAVNDQLGLDKAFRSSAGISLQAVDNGDDTFTVSGISIDTDADGLDDIWEQTVIDSDPDDAIETLADVNPGDDLDLDTLTNLQEFTFPQTDPLDPDSDDDGLRDDVETGSGIFVSLATDTGTDPNNPDTDGDGLLDGVETNDGTDDGPTDRGTHPLLADTDGDFANDGDEIAGGTDPNDAASAPFQVTVLGIGTGALLGGDLTDPEDDGVEGFGIGTGFAWVGLTSSSESYFGGFGEETEGAFDVFDNTVGGGNAKWCCSGPPQDITVEFDAPVSLTHFTLTSSDDSIPRDPQVWSISGSNDGTTFTPIFERDSDTSFWTARNQVLRFDLNAPAPAYKFIRYAVTGTGGNEHALNEIEYFGAPEAPIQITAFDYDPDAGTYRLTWSSTPGATYALFWSPDLADWGSDVDDNIESQGDTTTFPALDNPAAPLPFGAPEDIIFFRVQDNG